jgi:dTDP-4-amino-4,6-dideoxygalactose transaminase
MIDIKDYSNPFQAILDFEKAIAQFTGAPYCVTTDCCTHAIEIAFRLSDYEDWVTFPANTYLSVVMTMHKLNIPHAMTDAVWRSEYQFEGSRVWDSARRFEANMYRPGAVQCISFGRTKPLDIGKGGCLLTDDRELYERASRMRYDGRDIFNCTPWHTQTQFEVGYHYYLRPEDCVRGSNALNEGKFNAQLDSYYNYPDCRLLKINAPR